MGPGDVVGGRFELVRLAGRGGMGEVWRARDRQAGTDVAVKVMREDSPHAARLVREARILRELRHPAIVGLVADGHTERGEPWVAMDWVEGGDLAARLGRGPLRIADALALGVRLAGALGAAHARGVVHRDLKPANVLLPDGSVDDAKLVDFGVASASLGTASGTTQPGGLVGTPSHMAPEQARGERAIGPPADVFALGALLYETLAGRPAFAGDSVLAILCKVLLEDPPDLREVRAEVPPPLADAIVAMLAKDPSLRPKDGDVAGRVLAAILQARDATATETPTEGRPRSVRPVALGPAEQRVVALVLVGPVPREHTRAREDAPTIDVAQDPESAALGAIARAHGGVLQQLLDGSLVVALRAGVAIDRAYAAARCALAIRAHGSTGTPARPIAIATGRTGDPSLPAGEAIERAAKLLGAAGPGRIAVDDVTASLIESRFAVAEAGPIALLAGERAEPLARRTLLGRATPLVGRDREMRLLQTLAQDAFDAPRAGAALILGPPGAGKSRLADEALAALDRSGVAAETWIARADPVGGGPLALVARALRGWIGALDSDTPEARMVKLHARLGARVHPTDVARLEAFLAELAGAAPPPSLDRDLALQIAAARASPPLQRERVREAFLDLVGAIVSAGPLVFRLEDIHWADAPSLELIDAALDAAAERPIFVVATARPELAHTFPAIFRERGVVEVHLRALARPAAERLVREALGEPVAPETVARLVALSEGNPFFLEEAVRAFAGGGSEAPPATVVAMVQSRLEALDDVARRVLRAASVFGERAPRGALRALLGDLGDSTLDAALARLIAAEALLPVERPRFAGEREHAFGHALVREAAYAMLTDADRASAHAAAGQWLERAGEDDARSLATHFERGGRPDRALPWLVRAARQALEANDPGSALALVARADPWSPLDAALQTEVGRLQAIAAAAHGWRGEFAPAAAAGEEALARLPPGDPSWLPAIRATVLALGRTGSAERLRALADVILSDATAAVAAPLRAAVAASIATWLFYLGDPERARALLELSEGLDLDYLEEDPPAVVAIRFGRAVRAQQEGDPSTHLIEMLGVLRLAERAGDRRAACSARGNVGYGQLELGLIEDAERSLRATIAEATALGLPGPAATARENLGLALARLGRVEEGLAELDAAAAEFDRHGDERMAGAARSYSGRIRTETGEHARAERDLGEAERLLAIAPPLLAVTLADRARLELRRGRIADAVDLSSRASELLAELGSVEEGEAVIRLAHAEALEAAGQGAAARAAIAVARDRLLTRAEQIADGSWRDAFLALPEHARTLDLAARWV